MWEKCYYYDEDGNRCEGEVGPSFEDFSMVWQGLLVRYRCVIACKKSDFDENDDLTVCKAYRENTKEVFECKRL